jgi:tight adherence protein B
MMWALVALLGAAALGGAVFAFAGAGEKTKKRMEAVSKPRGKARGAKASAQDNNQARRKNVQVMLKELEQQQAAKKQRPTLRRRIETAGLTITVPTFWILSAVFAVAVAGGIYLAGAPIWAAPLGAFAAGLGIPRWVLGFLKGRREKAFTREFANAIDIIVRSVKTGRPVGEAMKVVSTEVPEPVSGEFKLLIESMKMGVTLEQGLKRMFERMPTPEVNFFAIVMTIQQKSGGNLSEALSNLAGVLRSSAHCRPA